MLLFIQSNFELSSEIIESLKTIDVDLARDDIAILESYNLAIYNDSLESNYPHLVKEWHPTKNGALSPQSFSRMSPKEVWWQCQYGHEWKARISNRTANNRGCPICYRYNTGRLIAEKTDLATVYPELVKQWHPQKNGNLTPFNVSYGSSKRVWWLCEHGYEWQAVINNRTHTKYVSCPCNQNKNKKTT